MLVVSRYINEEIRIGDDIRIVITDIRGGRVRIGIEAPEGVAVHRKEVYESIKAGNKPAKTTVVNTNSVINARPVAIPQHRGTKGGGVYDLIERVNAGGGRKTPLPSGEFR